MGTFPKYGPITEDLMNDAEWIASGMQDDTFAAADIADTLYDWYVKGLVFGINLTEENQ